MVENKQSFFIGVDVGGTNTDSVIVDMSNNLQII
jgi:N-methylhydantoinase A/oxoprolinase/acetone carboxylase beta subunit